MYVIVSIHILYIDNEKIVRPINSSKNTEHKRLSSVLRAKFVTIFMGQFNENNSLPDH